MRRCWLRERRRRNVYDKKHQRYAKDNRTAHLTARSDKSVAYVTNNKRLYSTLCTVEANYWQTRSIARPRCDSWATLYCWSAGGVVGGLHNVKIEGTLSRRENVQGNYVRIPDRLLETSSRWGGISQLPFWSDFRRNEQSKLQLRKQHKSVCHAHSVRSRDFSRWSRVSDLIRQSSSWWEWHSMLRKWGVAADLQFFDRLTCYWLPLKPTMQN